MSQSFLSGYLLITVDKIDAWCILRRTIGVVCSRARNNGLWLHYDIEYPRLMITEAVFHELPAKISR